MGADGFRDRQQGRESPADDIFCKCVTDAGLSLIHILNGPVYVEERFLQYIMEHQKKNVMLRCGVPVITCLLYTSPAGWKMYVYYNGNFRFRGIYI